MGGCTELLLLADLSLVGPFYGSFTFFKLFRLKNTLGPLYVVIRVTRYCLILLYCIAFFVLRVQYNYTVLANTSTIEYSLVQLTKRDTQQSLTVSNLRYSETIDKSFFF